MNPVEQTIDAYEKHSDRWIQVHDYTNWHHPVAGDFLGALLGKRILDIGCAYGKHAQYFTSQGYQVTGIDLTNAFLKEARKQVPEATFLSMDMRNLTFPNDSFDGIWCAAVLHHIAKTEAPSTLAGWARVLAPQGILYISVKHGTEEGYEQSDMKRYFAHYEPEELSKLVTEAGFKVLSTSVSHHKNGQFTELFGKLYK